MDQLKSNYMRLPFCAKIQLIKLQFEKGVSIVCGNLRVVYSCELSVGGNKRASYIMRHKQSISLNVSKLDDITMLYWNSLIVFSTHSSSYNLPNVAGILFIVISADLITYIDTPFSKSIPLRKVS